MPCPGELITDSRAGFTAYFHDVQAYRRYSAARAPPASALRARRLKQKEDGGLAQAARVSKLRGRSFLTIHIHASHSYTSLTLPLL